LSIARKLLEMPPCDVPYCLLKGLSKDFEENTGKVGKLGKRVLTCN